MRLFCSHELAPWTKAEVNTLSAVPSRPPDDDEEEDEDEDEEEERASDPPKVSATMELMRGPTSSLTLGSTWLKRPPLWLLK